MENEDLDEKAHEEFFRQAAISNQFSVKDIDLSGANKTDQERLADLYAIGTVSGCGSDISYSRF